MKVVHLLYSDTGGAGIAACRLHAALRGQGVDSRMLCIDKTSPDPYIYRYRIRSLPRRIEHLHIPVRQNKYRKIFRKAHSSYEVMSFPEAMYDISSHYLIHDADIVNLHWVGNMLNYPLFFRHVRQPIVWTLHDMNPFLGCAHYMGDVERNAEYSCWENRIREIKKKSVSQHPDINIVAPSAWMAGYSRASEMFSARPHHVIPNSIDTGIFRYYDKSLVRELFGIPADIPVLLFCSQSVNNPRKGFDLLAEALKMIDHRCLLLAIGMNSNAIQHENIRFLGNIHDEQLLALMYSCADAFVLPSREDNLPNVMLESLCCGTPVISMPNGGMRDCIADSVNGFIVPETTPESLAGTINSFLGDIHVFDRKSISDSAVMKYSHEVQAGDYISLYSRLVP